MEKRVRELLNQVVEGRNENKKELQQLLDFDDLNMAYFLILYKKFLAGGSREALTIATPGVSGAHLIYPTAIADQKMLTELPLVQYHQLQSNQSAKQAMLWVKKMQAGTGSSIIRRRYLDQMGLDGGKIGAKGTDLFTNDSSGKSISLVEVQILQALADAKFSTIKSQCLHDIVSGETAPAIDTIWKKDSGKKITYQELIDSDEQTSRGAKSYQYHIPTIDQDGQVSFNRKAPGGHALFGVEALIAAYKDEMRPASNGQKLISSIGNGEDLSSAPDDLMVSWMIDNKIPIAMVTTTKTEIDLKGGQIALQPTEETTFVTMIEKAQADEARQSQLFMELGLRADDKEAFFNTNMVLINYDVLTPLIKKLIDESGEEKFFEIIAPDLIVNAKKQKDSDGEVRTYRQLEGAMGTVYLNLDRYWRSRYGKPIVHFINVSRKNRTKFFSPVKTAFDFFMQFKSDRFELDYDTYRLQNCAPGILPQVDLKDETYKEVQNVLELFENCSISKLKQLKVSGVISFANCQLIGRVEIENNSGKTFELEGHDKIVEDVYVVIDENGAIRTKPLA